MKPPRIAVQESMEHRLLHGLSCEWENGLWILPAALRARMRPPHFRLGGMRRLLGYWDGGRREIVLARRLVLDTAWDCVVEVLLHEMAHQLAEEVLQAPGGPPHGAAFQEACRLLRANPRASGRYPTLRERVAGTAPAPQDRILARVKKLMALAGSANRFEAEAAMAKAHLLIERHNVDLLARDAQRGFVSLFVGRPALRHSREDYHLAHLLQEFYFVTGLWVPAYVAEKQRMGRVFEISGTARNVETAGYIHDFVARYIRDRWRGYDPEGKLGRRRRGDFAAGVIEGFRDKLALQRLPPPTAPPGSRPIAAVEDPRLRAYMAERYPHIRRFRRPAPRQDPQAAAAGRQAGRELVISRGITEKRGGPRLRIGGK